jgi:DNA repair protein RadC
MNHYGSLDRLARASAAELARIKGVGSAKAVQLRAAFEMGSRLAQSRIRELPMDKPEQVCNLLGDEMRQLPHESLRVIALNGKLRLLAIEEISRGTINETVAHPRDVLRVPILNQAYGFILTHNHPSGDPAPSQSDFIFTRKVCDAAKIMQVPFLDHVILGAPRESGPSWFSFKEAGLL